MSAYPGVINPSVQNLLDDKNAGGSSELSEAYSATHLCHKTGGEVYASEMQARKKHEKHPTGKYPIDYILEVPPSYGDSFVPFYYYVSVFRAFYHHTLTDKQKRKDKFNPSKKLKQKIKDLKETEPGLHPYQKILHVLATKEAAHQLEQHLNCVEGVNIEVEICEKEFIYKDPPEWRHLNKKFNNL